MRLWTGWPVVFCNESDQGEKYFPGVFDGHFHYFKFVPQNDIHVSASDKALQQASTL